MKLNDLKILLEHPEHLKSVIEDLRNDRKQSEEIKGFISLYDHLGGNTIEIKKYLKETKQLFEAPSTNSKKKFDLLKYVAFVLVIFGISFLIYFSYSVSKEREKIEIIGLYNDPGIPIYMSEETKINWGELMFAIKEKTPEEAEKVWLKIVKSAPNNDTALYYGGIVYRNLNISIKANYYFNLNLKIKSVFHDQSQYFLAINEWEKGNLSKAKDYLLILENAQNPDIREAATKHLKEKNFKN